MRAMNMISGILALSACMLFLHGWLVDGIPMHFSAYICFAVGVVNIAIAEEL